MLFTALQLIFLLLIYSTILIYHRDARCAQDTYVPSPMSPASASPHRTTRYQHDTQQDLTHNHMNVQTEICRQ